MRSPKYAQSRAVDVAGPSVYQGGKNLKVITTAAVFKRVSLLIGVAKNVDRGR